ncbi:hypothetical protein B0H10DRAFT_2223392 [Mycena sp. CBHHK59/15]|nr:hypothetical protein B0H10DRAFT_2223392 [Mycena sp. CBHHK59/15]
MHAADEDITATAKNAGAEVDWDAALSNSVNNRRLAAFGSPASLDPIHATTSRLVYALLNVYGLL